MSREDKLQPVHGKAIESFLEKGAGGSLACDTALQRALDIQLACAKVGFDWPQVDPVFDKVLEEIDEVKAEVYTETPDIAKIEDELGDLLFAVVNLCRHLGVHPDTALNKASDKFVQRFDLVKSFAVNDNADLAQLSIEELELLWQRAKEHIKHIR